MAGGRRGSGTGITDPVVAACSIAWLLAPLSATVRALRTGWYPISDEALIAIRARDVLTEHHPLVGTAATAALGDQYLINHPGPLIFDLAAAPVRLFGSGSGLAIAIAAINFGSGLVAILAAARQGGRIAALATTVGLAILVWSAGNEVLIDPFNPTASMVPFFAVLVLAWSVANSDRWALPWLVAFSSFCLQTNLSYSIITLPIVLGALCAFTWRLRGQRPVRTIVMLCIPIGVVLWFQPLLEQVIHGGDGNLSRLVGATGHLERSLGVVEGTKRAASAIVVPPAWWRRGEFTDYGVFERLPSAFVAFGALLALLVLLATLTILCRRRFGSDWTTTLLASTAAFVGIGWFATMRLPLAPRFGFSPNYLRWLWPIAALCVVAVLAAIGRAVHETRLLSQRVMGISATLILGLAVAAEIPAAPGTEATRGRASSRAAASELSALGVKKLPPSGAEFDFPGDTFHIGYPLLAAMHEAGVPFFLDDPIELVQFGPGRRPPTGQQLPGFVLMTSLQAIESWDRALVCVSELDTEERERFRDVRDALASALTRPGFDLTEDGRRVANGPLGPPWMADVPDGRPVDARTIVSSPEFTILLDRQWIIPPPGLTDDAREFVELRRAVENTTACIVERDD